MKSKYLSTWMQRVAVVLLVLSGSIGSALAQTKLYIENFSISAGETKQVAVCLDTDKDNFSTVSMTIALPTGLTFETKELMPGKPVMDVSVNTSRAVGFTAVGNPANGKLSLTSINNTIASGKGPLFYVKVKASEDLAVTSSIKLNDADLLDKTKTHFKTSNGNLTVTNATVTKLNDISVAFAQTPITMDPGGTYSMAVNMTNKGRTIYGFQADLKLPTGWKATVADGRLKNAGKDNRILYAGDKENPIPGEEGMLFTLNLVAPANFTTGTAKISLENIHATAGEGMSDEVLANITLTVNANGGAETGKPVVAFTQAETVIGAGKTGRVDIDMQNAGLDIKGFQADVVLPTGWTAEVVNGRLTNAGNNKRVMYADFMNSIPGEEGVLFSLNLTAPATFTGEAVVRLTGIRATVGFAEKSLDDISITVKANDAKAKAEADAILTELQAKYDKMKASVSAEDAESLQKEITALKTEVETKYKDATLVSADVKKAADAISAKIDAAVEAAALAAANAKQADLKKAVEALKVSAEAKAYDNEGVKKAVSDAEKAIAEANTAVEAVTKKITEGKLSTENKEALAAAVTAAEKAIEAAQKSIETAQKAYTDQKAADEEAAAKAAAEAKLGDLKTAAEALKVSAEAKAYDNEDVKKAVSDAEKAIAEANAAVAAAEAKIAEGKVATDNKDAVAAALETAQQAIEAAKPVIEAAEKTYADQKAADEAAAAEAAAKEAALAAQAKVKADAAAAKEAVAPEVAEDATVKAAVNALDNAIAILDNTIAYAEKFKDNGAIAAAQAAAEKAVTELTAQASAAKEAYDQRKAASDAAYAKLSEQLSAVQAKLDAAKKDVTENAADVAAQFEQTIKDIQAQIDALKSKLDADKEAVALTAESTIDTDTIEAAIAKLTTDAAQAEEAYKAEQAKKAANEAAYTKLSEQLNAVQAKLDDAKKDVTENAADVAAQFEQTIKGIQAQIEALKTKLDADHDAVALTAESTIDTAAIEEAITKLTTDAAQAEEAYKAEQAEKAKKAANEAAYTKLSEQLNGVQAKLDAAKKDVTENAADVAAQFEQTIKDIQAQIDALKTKLDADKEAVALTAESAIDTAAIEAAITKLTTDAAQAEEAYKADVANDAAYAKLSEQLNAVQAKLDAAKKDVTENAADVAAQFEQTIQDIQAQIDALKTKLDADHDAVTLAAESTIDTAAIEEAITKLTTDATQAEEAYKAEKAKKAANEAAYNKLNEQLNGVQAKLDAAKKDVTENAADVAAQFEQTIKDIQAQIDALKTKLDTDNEAVALTAESTIDTADIEEAITKLTTDAAQAEEAYKAEKAKKAANEAAYNKLSEQLNGVQAKLDAARMTIATSCPDVADEFDTTLDELQAQLDQLKTKLNADKEAVALTAESTIDTADIEEAIIKAAKDAGKAQKEHDNKVAANKEAYKNLTSQLKELQAKLEEAKKQIEEYGVDMSEDFDAIQQKIDQMTAEVEQAFDATQLTEDSSIDYEGTLQAIAETIEKARLLGIDDIMADDKATFYNLQGVKVEKPVKGQTYVVRKAVNGKTTTIKIRM